MNSVHLSKTPFSKILPEELNNKTDGEQDLILGNDVQFYTWL